jgi:hypothetical protein
MIQKVFISIFLLIAVQTQAQNAFSLAQAIDYALKNG